MTAIVIAIAVVVVLAALLLVAVARRRDTGAATGELSRETRKRDRSGVVLTAPRRRPTTPPCGVAPTSAPLRSSASAPAARSSRSARLRRPCTSRPIPRRSASPGASSSTARSSGSWP